LQNWKLQGGSVKAAEQCSVSIGKTALDAELRELILAPACFIIASQTLAQAQGNAASNSPD